MKIIKEGNLPEDKQKRETCYNCKTVFEYVKADVQSDFRDGDYIVCPKCGKFITAGKFIPKVI